MNLDLSTRNVWQQAAGDKDRNYIDICIRWEVILFGPGYAGKWPECKEDLLADGWTQRKMSIMRRFAEEIKDGDIIVLREGTATVYAVGIVIGDYRWHDEFGDIDGWDLQHIRRVKWLWSDLVNPKIFPVHTLKFGDTTQILTSKTVADWIDTLNLKVDANETIVELPKMTNQEIDFDKVTEFLFDQGVASSSIERLTREIGELIRIAKWYQKYADPSEFETVAYLAVPLLRALGWTPQKMAIEWNNVDIALFSQLPRINENLSVVVEAKKKGNSCLTAFSQAQSYSIDKTNCKRLIVTDGLRYGIYVRSGKTAEYELYAYFNITRLKEEYPIYECHGVKDALRAMTPEWIGHSETI